MVRSSPQAAEEAPVDPSSLKARCKNGALPLSSGKKLSREALSLINSQIIRYNNPNNSAVQLAALTDKGRRSAPGSGSEASPDAGHHRRVPSAPPVVHHGEELELPERQRNHGAGPASKDNGPGTKRSAAATGAPEDQVREDHEHKQHKKKKTLERQGQQARSVGVGGADVSGQIKNTIRVSDPAAPSTSAEADADAHPAGSKRNKKGARASKGKDQPAADAGAKGAQASNINATEPDAAVSRHSKKPRKEKSQMATAALIGQAGPSNPAKGRETEMVAALATSQLEDTVATQHISKQTETAALTISAHPGNMTEQRIMAAVAAGPEPLGARQEGATNFKIADADRAGPGANATGLQSNKGSAAGAQEPAAEPANADEAGRSLPATGIKPVNALLPARLPRPEETNAQEKLALVELQRQLSEWQGMYKELKATKIEQMDKLLAEMAERAEGRVSVAEQLAQHWQAVAKRAQEDAIAAGSVETANRIDALETEANQLLKQNQSLLQRVTQLQLELSLAQQELHDARAELLQFRMPTVRDVQADAKDKDKGSYTPLQGCATAEAEHGKDVNGPQRAAADAAVQESSPDVTLGGVRHHAITDAAETGGRAGGEHCSLSLGRGLKFPTLSPGAGEQTANDLSVVPGSSSRSVGISTDCQRIVQMLPSIRSPSRSIQSHQGRLPRTSAVAPSFDVGLLGDVPRAGSLSSERGIDTACQRIIQMLPELRQQSPSIEPRSVSRAEPVTNRDAPSGVTPAAADGNETTLRVQEGSSKRLSDGSPIDGICGPANRKITCASTQADLTHAHNMCAPEALGSAAHQQARVRQAGPIRNASVLVTAAATKALPPTPGLQQQADSQDVSPRAIPIHSGSVASNQVSCNLSGLVARAMAQPQESQQAIGMPEVGRAPQARGDRSPVSANMALATQPPYAMAAASVIDPTMQAGNAREVPQGNKNLTASSPSPRTAKLNFYERLLEWHIDVISTKPLEAFRMTHMACGMSFEIRETEVDDDDLPEDGGGADQPAAGAEGNTTTDKTKYYEYTPLDLGTVGELLPAFLKETITIPADQRPKLLEKLDGVIKSTRGKKL
ncbi:hypothetical protein Vretimale_11984 [Volvox reticuliferus]|uniref:Uncharacterized protein n=1 Tax=Volvox reticuliferus TaxID=1737510 RepID=A0A8J4GHR1_9CHLO|nr:hypothetical protein Vretimale_11984 [Volvox reticuliferus]